jgi:hypothetical protein
MRKAGLRELSFRLEFEGSKVIFNIVSRDARLAHIERQERNGHGSYQPEVTAVSALRRARAAGAAQPVLLPRP